MNQADAVDTLLVQAQTLIIKDSNDAAKQLRMALAGAEQLSVAQRISLGFSLGLAQFASSPLTVHALEDTLGILHDALVLADTQPFPARKPALKGAYDPVKAQQLISGTLSSLAARNCVAFAFGGVLLGLTRDGRLLPFDKDLDVVVPQSHFSKVCELLRSDGWKPCWVPVIAENFACFVDAETGITLDVFAYAFNHRNERVLGGWWPRGLQREQGRLLEFSSFDLELSTQVDGRFWRIKQPEVILAQLYGENWRVPDPLFDASLETPALINWTAYTRVWASLKLLEAWTQGRADRISRILDVLRARDASDPLCKLFMCVQSNHEQ